MKQNNRRAHGRAGRRATEALAAAAAIAGGVQAYAAPVRFDNPPGPGHFNWVPMLNGDVTLDLTLDAASQAMAAAGPSSLTQGYFLFGFPPYPAVNPYSYLAGTQGSGPLLTTIAGPFAAYVNDIPDGTVVNNTLPFNMPTDTVAAIYYRYIGPPQLIYTYLPEGVPAYVGVKMTLADGLHFGWMRVIRSGRSLDALAWGYESDPNTPITAGAGGAILGDMNDDHVVNAEDVPAFVASVLDLPLPPGSVDRADMNADMLIDGDDIQPFVAAVIH